MATSEDIKLIIEAQDRASKQLDTITKALGGFIEKSEKSTSTLANLSKAAAGYFAIDKLKSFGAASVQEFAKAEKSAVLLEHTLKQTGNTTGMTAKQIQEYAESIEDLTGIEQESVQDAAAILARNSKITGDQFKDILRIATDMAAVEGTVSQHAEMLGKALSDPETAISKLRRSGIIFSADQEQVIEKLIKTGKEAEALTMILEKADAKFAGMAKKLGETTSGKLTKANIFLGNVQEKVGEGFVAMLVDPLESFIKTWSGKEAKETQELLNNTQKLHAPADIAGASDPLDARNTLDAKLRGLLNAKRDIETKIDELREVGVAEALNDVFGDGSISRDTNRQWDELHGQLKQVEEDMKAVEKQADAIRSDRFNFTQGLIPASMLSAAANKIVTGNLKLSQRGNALLGGDEAFAVADQINKDAIEAIMRANQTEQEKLQEELRKLLIHQGEMPAELFKRAQKNIEDKLAEIATRSKNTGIQGILGGAEGIFDAAEKQAEKALEKAKQRTHQEAHELAATESRFLTRGPGNDPTLAAALEGNVIARQQLEIQRRQVAAIDKLIRAPKVVVRGI